MQFKYADESLDRLVHGKDLSLSVLKPDADLLGGRLTLARSNGQVGSYDVQFFACDQPACGCGNLIVYYQAAKPEGEPALDDASDAFLLDVQGRKAVSDPEFEISPSALALASDFAAALTPEEWLKLNNWFRITKLEMTYRLSDSQFSATEFPDVDENRLISFQEVFPMGLDLHFKLHGQIWAVDDAYCVRSNCSCGACLLAFIRLQENPEQPAQPLDDLPTIDYDYKTQELNFRSPGAVGNPPIPVLMEALKAFEIDLHQKLHFRHLLLQLATGTRKHHELEKGLTQNRTPVRRVGRNEPCPCGSGRKYKHCCGKN